MRSNLKARVERANQNNLSKVSEEYNNYQEERNLKFIKSRKQCDIQIQQNIKLLNDCKFEMEDSKKNKTKQALRSFQNQYDKYMNQVLKQVRDILQNNKKRIMQSMASDRQRDTQSQKQIRRAIDQHMSQLKQMKKGLGTESYREHIAKIVTHDFTFETMRIKQNIGKLSYPGVHMRLDQKRRDCYRSDIQKLIICDQYSKNEQYSSSVNMHQNRDFIKKSQWK